MTEQRRKNDACHQTAMPWQHHSWRGQHPIRIKRDHHHPTKGNVGQMLQSTPKRLNAYGCVNMRKRTTSYTNRCKKCICHENSDPWQTTWQLTCANIRINTIIVPSQEGRSNCSRSVITLYARIDPWNASMYMNQQHTVTDEMCLFRCRVPRLFFWNSRSNS